MVTFSPHYPASLDYTAALTALGVHVAIGHTHAAPAEIRAAVDAGASFSTHLGNGCHASLPRHPNYIWAQLAEDRLTAGLPADGHHLPADTFIAMLRAKGLQRVVLVSDSVALAGMPSGRYRTAVGDHVDLTEDGRLVQAGTGHLAGAACSLADGVVRAVGMARITLGDAVRLAASNPGRYVGDRGVLRPGTSGDVIQFRWSPDDTRLDIQAVLVAGAAG